jgi:hypothetical protein
MHATSPCVLYALPISFSLNCSFELHLVRSTIYDNPHYSNVCNFFPFYNSSDKIFSTALRTKLKKCFNCKRVKIWTIILL